MMSNALRHPKLGIGLLLVSTLLTGCWERRTGLTYLGEGGNQYYKDAATSIDFPDATQESPEEVLTTAKPRTVKDRSKDEIWEMTLSDAITTALENNRVIRSDAAFLSPGNSLFTNPDRVASVYDPAIQESGFLFGGRGIESALSAFDARWDTRVLWGRNSTYNNIAAAPGSATSQETANFDTSLTKAFAYGGQVQLGHNVNYLGSNASGQMFPSTYTGSLTAEYRQPLLAGSGAEYTRIAGPITQSFGGITGVTQGVVIARINNDITIADLEANIRNLILDVELLYWDLYLSYVQFDTATQARESARQVWQRANAKNEVGDLIFDDMSDSTETIEDELRQVNATMMQGSQNVKADLYQAMDAYYQAQAAVDRARSQIYSSETRFRRLLGLRVNDGRIIRPKDVPLTGEFVPDWYAALADGLTNRVELRRQKWSVKSLELQLTAAKSLTRPRLDFVTSARVNGLGDDLLGSGRADGVSPNGLDNLYGTLGGGDTTGWGAGVEMSIPIGYRSALAQVRNIELRLSKARELLSVQEMEISHEIATSLQDIAVAHENLQSLFNRKEAAKDYEETLRIQVLEGGRGGLADDFDRQIRAIATVADAESAYFQALVTYNKALAQYQYRKGTLLEYNNIHLAENQWDPEAYEDALRRARERGHAFKDDHIEAEPRPFSLGPINPHELQFRPPAGEGHMVPLPEETDGELKSDEPAPSPPAEEEKPYDAETVQATTGRKTLRLRSLPDSSLLAQPIVSQPQKEQPRGSVNPILTVQPGLNSPAIQAASHQTMSRTGAAPVSSERTSFVELMPIKFGEPDDSASSPTAEPVVRPQHAAKGKTIPSPPQWPGSVNQSTPKRATEARSFQTETPFSPHLAPENMKPSPEGSDDDWHSLNLKSQ
ncbi:MAG: TolC family protein [Planctomycetaceae bacterium]|nr:TolC family protein [Planctomycetaceae bacterium]